MQETTQLEAMLVRLERVEAQNRRLKWAGGLLFLLLASFGLMGSGSTAKSVQGKEFTLVDESGKTRIRLGLHDGSPELLLLDTKEKTRARMLLEMGLHLKLSLFDKEDDRRLVVGLNPEESLPRFQLFDVKGRMRTELELGWNGAPRIKLFDETGRAVWKVP